MHQLARRTISATVGVAALSAMVFLGTHLVQSTHASSQPIAAATPVAGPAAALPANGFTEVAKAVTPAVVNITTVMTEKVADGRSMPDELRERMEEFFGGPNDRSDREGFEGHKGRVSREVIVAAVKGQVSSSLPKAMC